MHWAIVGQPRMRLTNWSNDRPGKADVGVAKNYLNQDELFALNLIVAAYLDFAELQAFSRKPMTMSDWIAKLDDFVRISDRQILTHVGTVSHEAAVLKAESELEKFRASQDALPQPVDAEFEKVVGELRKVEGVVKKRGGKRKGGEGE